MPGIAGILGLGNTEENSGRLRQMVSRMMHEPFYRSGQHISEEIGAWLGWVCFKDSFSDCMPIWNEKRNICMIFSGEEFSAADRIDELRGKGHEFEEGDASYLVHLYEELDNGFLESLNGVFSGIILDYRRKTVVLFNDRYGLSRIYCYESANTLYFSSEAKSLLALFPDIREIDIGAMGQIFSFGAVLGNKTLFSRLSLLPGGSAWTCRPGRSTRKRKYFDENQWESLDPKNADDYYQELKDTWIRILPRYLRSSEPIALSLTGGKDSRMILAWNRSAPGSLPCFTFGGVFRECADVKIARNLANICRQPFCVVQLDESFLSQFHHYASKTVYISDGTVSVSGSPGLYVNRLAREVAPIRLTGNFGQEILSSYISFKPIRLNGEILNEDFNRHIEKAPLLYAEALRRNRLSFVVFKQLPWAQYPSLAAELSQLTLRSPYLDNDLVRLAYMAPPGPILRDDVQLRLIADGNCRLSKVETDKGLLFKPLPIYSLLKRRYQQITFKAEYAFDYGMPRSLVKIDNLFRPLHLERLFLGRHKFYHFRKWYRDELSEYIKEILLDHRSINRPYLNGSHMEKAINAHIHGQANLTTEISKLLTLELIHRQFIDSHDQSSSSSTD